MTTADASTLSTVAPASAPGAAAADREEVGREGGGSPPPPAPSVRIAVLSPPSPAECAAHAEGVASRLRRMGPDRYSVTVLAAHPPSSPPHRPSPPPGKDANKTKSSSSSSSMWSLRGSSKKKEDVVAPPPAAAAVAADAADRPDPTVDWPDVHVLVLCLSGAAESGYFPFEDVKRYVDRSAARKNKKEEQKEGGGGGGGQASAAAAPSVVVMTDLDLDRTLSDRASFYDALEAGGLGSLLPRRACARFYPSGSNDAVAAAATVVVDRRDLVEVGRSVLLKPVLERPIDPSDPELRIYYPRSGGGGCKVVAHNDDGRHHASSFLADERIKVRGAGVGAGVGRKGRGREEGDEGESEGKVDGDVGSPGLLGFIYEELLPEGGDDGCGGAGGASVVGVEEQQRERRYRKRDRLRDAASLIVPDNLLRRGGGAGAGYYDDEEVTTESDLSRPDRKFCIVTTAALPWMTGTAVNPLLRAAYLSRGRPRGAVTLVVPWLERAEDRGKLYGSVEFGNEKEQERYIREWLRDKAGMVDEADEETGLHILFYPARYHPQLGSIFAMGDICALIPDSDADVCVLEEPEHLNWYRAKGKPWTVKFTYVVGIVHTNYRAYASAHPAGLVAGPIVSRMSELVVRAYCHKIIKLSAVLQTFAPEKEVVSNVHGVRAEFLIEGERRAKALSVKGESDATQPDEGEGSSDDVCVYFIGKILWAKGLDRLLHLEEFYKDCTGSYFDIDIYGDGPELTEIRRAYHGRSGGKKRKAAVEIINKLTGGGGAAERGAEDGSGDADVLGGQSAETRAGVNVDTSSIGDAKEEAGALSSTERIGDNSTPRPDGKNLKRKAGGIEMPVSMHEWRLNAVPARFLGRIDHALLTEPYKIVVNPSITEVLCTTTAEALAMGKFAIIPVHPSNTFFMQFPNCLAFRNKLEFAANLQWALTHDPEPLTEELAYQFTWEAATERFIRASAITMREGRERAKAKKSRLDERIAELHNRIAGGQKGDVLRTILGAGPASGQTKYETARPRSSSFAYDASITFDGTGQDEKKRQERVAASAGMAVLLFYLLVTLWHAVDWSQLVTGDEL